MKVLRTLSAAHQAIEDRRNTQHLTQKEYDYLRSQVRLRDCPSKELEAQLVNDAILYHSTNADIPARAQGGRDLTYYLRIKAKFLYADYGRLSLAERRGSGKVVSLEAQAARLEGAGMDYLGAVADESSTDVAGELDMVQVLTAIRRVLQGHPERLRVLELHMEGYSYEGITETLGWVKVKDNNKVDTGRVRKNLFDTKAMLAAALPGLAKGRNKQVLWADGNENRPTTYLSSKECEYAALELEGPVSHYEVRRMLKAA